MKIRKHGTGKSRRGISGSAIPPLYILRDPFKPISYGRQSDLPRFPAGRGQHSAPTFALKVADHLKFMFPLYFMVGLCGFLLWGGYRLASALQVALS